MGPRKAARARDCRSSLVTRFTPAIELVIHVTGAGARLQASARYRADIRGTPGSDVNTLGRNSMQVPRILTFLPPLPLCMAVGITAARNAAPSICFGHIDRSSWEAPSPRGPIYTFVTLEP